MKNDPKKLKPKELRKTIDPKKLTKDEVVGEIIGQERVKRTLKLLGIPDKHFHIFVAGASETGKTKQVLAELKKIAKNKDTPPDIAYVHNFSNPEQPRKILFPARTAKKFANDLVETLKNIQTELTDILHGSDIAMDQNLIFDQIQKEMETKFSQSKIKKGCEKIGFEFIFPQSLEYSIRFLNDKDTHEIDEAEILDDYKISQQIKTQGHLMEPQALKQTKENLQKKYHNKFDETISLVMNVYQKFIYPARKEAMNLYRKAVITKREQIVKSLFFKLRKKYPEAREYLIEACDNFIKFIDLLCIDDEGLAKMPMPQQQFIYMLRQQYNINIIVAQQARGAPIVVRTNPTHSNLFGYIEKIETKEGLIKSTFQDIRAGDIHKANGGYLIIDALNIFEQYLGFEVWSALQRTLKDGKIQISDPREAMGMHQTSLQPEPIPLDIKIILVGPKWLYGILNRTDPKFTSLFHKAEVETESNLTPKLQKQIASHLQKFSLKKTKGPITPNGLALVLEYGLELVESQEKISMQIGELEKLILEANLFSNKTNKTKKANKADKILIEDVERALEERKFRNNLIEERYFEYIGKNFIKTDVDGKKIGEKNGLVVVNWDNYTFGYPTKITANATEAEKEGSITFIDQEAELTGEIFNKAGKTISSWFRKTFFWKKFPYNVTVAFEQSYAGIEGDSASIAEVAVIASEIQKVPLRQDIAVTGSMNQKGVIQPIGGVNYKIKGFYKACKQHGLTGTQGVIIPKDNVKDLMLPKEIIESVKQGKFHIYPVEKIEEALRILSND